MVLAIRVEYAWGSNTRGCGKLPLPFNPFTDKPRFANSFFRNFSFSLAASPFRRRSRSVATEETGSAEDMGATMNEPTHTQKVREESALFL